MTGRPGDCTMDMIGGNTASYLACTPCAPVFLFILIGLKAKGLLDFQVRRGIASIVRCNLRPVIFGVDSFRKLEKAVAVSGICSGVREESCGENSGKIAGKIFPNREMLQIPGFRAPGKANLPGTLGRHCLDLDHTFRAGLFGNRQFQPSRVFQIYAGGGGPLILFVDFSTSGAGFGPWVGAPFRLLELGESHQHLNTKL